MAMSSVSSAQSLSSGLWVQLQQQQAQRAADQAEQKARSLQAQAQDAQSVANRAQENARSLKVQSEQAQGDASSAKMNVVAQQSRSELSSQFADWHEQLSSALATEDVTTASSTNTAQPVLNAEGQTTGALLSVTA